MQNENLLFIKNRYQIIFLSRHNKNNFLNLQQFKYKIQYKDNTLYCIISLFSENSNARLKFSVKYLILFSNMLIRSDWKFYKKSSFKIFSKVFNLILKHADQER